MSRPNQQEQQLVRKYNTTGVVGTPAPASANAVNTTYKPYVPSLGPGRKNEDDLSLPMIRNTLICSTDRAVADNIYELRDGDNISHMRMWLVCESVKDPDSSELLEKVPAAIQHLKTSKSCVVTNVACARFATPKDKLSRTECDATDKTNVRRHEHNKMLTRLLTSFVTKNGCGTSAGRLTCPSLPASFVENMSKELAESQKDPLKKIAEACTYLKGAGVLPMTDYQIEDATQLADAVAYYHAACDKLAELMHRNPPVERLRIPGCPPSTWNGLDETDSGGEAVRWCAGSTHTFWHPDVFMSFVSSADPTRTVTVYGSDTMYNASSPEHVAFNARDRFARTVQQLLTTRESKQAVYKYCTSSLDVDAITKTHPAWFMCDIIDIVPEKATTEKPSSSSSSSVAPIRAPGPDTEYTQNTYPGRPFDSHEYDSEFKQISESASSGYSLPQPDNNDPRVPTTMTTFSMSGSGVSARVADVEREMEAREHDTTYYRKKDVYAPVYYDPSDILPAATRDDLARRGRYT